MNLQSFKKANPYCSPYWEDRNTNSFCGFLSSHFRIASCFWTWWRSQPPPKHHSDLRPYCRARKYLGAQSQWVNVPTEVVEDLIAASRNAIISDINSLVMTNGSVAVSVLHIQQMLEVIDTCYVGVLNQSNQAINQ